MSEEHKENHKGHGKVTEDQRREICRKYATGKYLQKELATEYGLAKSTISNITRGSAGYTRFGDWERIQTTDNKAKSEE